jgi:thymidylate synthase (FAD)
MQVTLVDKMGDDARVADVARVSFAKWKGTLDDKDIKLINYLANHEHTSPFRHVALSLRCEAPIFLARQLGKHQVGLSWNEVSRRYVDAPPEFYYPDSWRSRPDGSVKQGSGEEVSNHHVLRMVNNVESWDIETGNLYQLCVEQCLQAYDAMLKGGIAPEMARMILPQSMMTSWIWTGSLQAFYHIYRLRIDPHAQKEAQVFAEMLDDICSKEFPYAWKALKEAE